MAPPASRSRFRRKIGYTVTKTLMADEIGREGVALARRTWRSGRQPRMRQEPHRLVFIDETGTTTKMSRLRSRARRRQRYRARPPFNHWGTQTFVTPCTTTA